MPKLLLFVFATHAPFFAWRWARTRETRYAATTLTFCLLIVCYGLRVFAPAAVLAGTPLYTLARIPALAAAAVSLALLARHHLRNR